MNEILIFIVVMTIILGFLPESKIKAIGKFFKGLLPKLPKDLL